jgi:hypothetical protein
MQSLMNLLGDDRGAPQGVPLPIAIAVYVGGYTEEETREWLLATIDDEDPQTIDCWIEAMREVGYFNVTDLPLSLPSASASAFEGEQSGDAATLLWDSLKIELQFDESDFKHRVAVLDNCVKKMGDLQRIDIHELSSMEAEHLLPFKHSGITEDNFPWHGCKFAANAILLLVSKPNVEAKRSAVAPGSRSLGGLSLPSRTELHSMRWPYELSKAFAAARYEAETNGTCTALNVLVTDVEIMRNPGKQGSVFASRPGTFAHTFIMTVSPVGVYLLQAYGPLGYTLLQHLEDEGSTFPMSLSNGEAWVHRFEEFAADLSGKWNEKVNAAYSFCFNADLVKLGNMRLGSQLDAYSQVYSIEFDVNTVQDNFGLLPKKSSGTKRQCLDGRRAKSAQMVSCRYKADGGVKHYYVPKILRCGACGIDTGQNSICSSCKVVSYCSRDCQVKDWKAKHKVVCKNFCKRK